MAEELVNIDEMCPPFQLKLGGKIYTVADITDQMMLKAMKLQREMDELQKNPDVDDEQISPVTKQLALLLKVSPTELVNLDFKKKLKALEAIMNHVTKGLGDETNTARGKG